MTVSTQGFNSATVVAESNAAGNHIQQATAFGTFDVMTVTGSLTFTSAPNSQSFQGVQAITFARGVGIVKSEITLNGVPYTNELTNYQIP